MTEPSTTVTPTEPTAPNPPTPAPDLLQPAPTTPEPAPTSLPAPNVVEYEPTGDASLDVALAFFGKQGLGLDSPELDQAGKGNFSYLEARFAAMGDKAPPGWREHVNLARDAHARMEATKKTEFEELQKSIHDAVGGAENWKEVVAFAQEHFKTDAAKLDEVKDALNGGGLAAIAMATYLHYQALGSKSTGNISGQSAVDSSAIVAASGGAGAITDPAVFKAEQHKLIQQFGFQKYDQTPEWQALLRRRKY